MKLRFSILLTSLLVLCLNSCHQPQPTKIISYNIRLSTVDDGPNHWKLRKQATLRMIESEQPAAFGLQEAMPEQLAYLDSNLTAYKRVGVGRDLGDESGEHCAIYYRAADFECLEHKTRWLSETPEQPSFGWDAACKRTATWIKLKNKTSGECFWYINTHLDHIGKTARKESVLLLTQWIEKLLEEEKLPVILSGDMNSTLEDPIFEPLLAILQVAQQTAPQTDVPYTYNGWGKVNPPSAIDHIFYTGVKPLVFDNLDHDFGVPFISDHYPIAFVWKSK